MANQWPLIAVVGGILIISLYIFGRLYQFKIPLPRSDMQFTGRDIDMTMRMKQVTIGGTGSQRPPIPAIGMDMMMSDDTPSPMMTPGGPVMMEMNPPPVSPPQDRHGPCPPDFHWDRQLRKCVPNVTPTPTPKPGGKHLVAFLRSSVQDSTWLSIWKGILMAGDLARVNPAVNVSLPDQITSGLVKFAEFTSAQAVITNAPRFKQLGLSTIGFDFESGPGFGTPQDLANPISAIQSASRAAHQAGLLFELAVDHKLGTQLGAQIANYADFVNFQGQGLVKQQGVQAYANYVIPLARQSRQINSNIQIISQVSTRYGPLSLMQQMAASVINDVDIISIWPDTNIIGWDNLIRQFGMWFRSKY